MHEVLTDGEARKIASRWPSPLTARSELSYLAFGELAELGTVSDPAMLEAAIRTELDGLSADFGMDDIKKMRELNALLAWLTSKKPEG